MMTGMQWFAFVILPVGVVVIAWAGTWVAERLIR